VTGIWCNNIFILFSVSDPDQGSGAFLTLGTGIWDGLKSRSESGIRIRDEHLGSKKFFGLKYLNSLRSKIRDPK
jgi:hypothetical protein